MEDARTVTLGSEVEAKPVTYTVAKYASLNPKNRMNGAVFVPL